MRSVIVVVVVALSSASVGAQQPAKQPALSREQVAFRSWAKAMRETANAAQKIPAKKRDAWLARTTRAKEDKLLAKYKTTRNELRKTFENGLILHWQADMPEDLAVAQAILDPMILDREIGAWAVEHSPPGRRPSVLDGPVEKMADIVIALDDLAEWEAKAPIVRCGAKLADGTACGRKTVGESGQRCYEHRH